MKNVILVAGFDYAFKGVSFRSLVEKRMKSLIAANTAKDDMTFTILDVGGAEVATHAITYPGGTKTAAVTKVTPSPFTKPAMADFDRFFSNGEVHYKLKDGRSGLMSATDIYSEVQKIGADTATAGTLMELSIFSHGSMGGPIFLNSHDDSPGGGRDPDDFDPRIKDFSIPTMDTAALDSFQKAFHPDGFSWLWGCAFPRTVHEILHRVEHHASYKSSGLADDVVFHFTNFNTLQATTLETWLQTELGGPIPDKKNFDIEFKFLKLFFCKIISASYLHFIAMNSKVKAFGAVMGTYSGYDGAGGGRTQLMRVSNTFSRHFSFYKNYFGFAFDLEGRNYGVYTPDFVCPPP